LPQQVNWCIFVVYALFSYSNSMKILLAGFSHFSICFCRISFCIFHFCCTFFRNFVVIVWLVLLPDFLNP
jgi:hypothetical protein